jgi:hypothetical protein
VSGGWKWVAASVSSLDVRVLDSPPVRIAIVAGAIGGLTLLIETLLPVRAPRASMPEPPVSIGDNRPIPNGDERPSQVRRERWSMKCLPRPFTAVEQFEVEGEHLRFGPYLLCGGFGGKRPFHSCRALDGTPVTRRPGVELSYRTGWLWPRYEHRDALFEGAAVAPPNSLRIDFGNTGFVRSPADVLSTSEIDVGRLSPPGARLARVDDAGAHVFLHFEPPGCTNETCWIAAVVDDEGEVCSSWGRGGGKTAAPRPGEWFLHVDAAGIPTTFDWPTGRTIATGNRSLTDGDPVNADTQLAANGRDILIAWRHTDQLRVRTARIARDGSWTLERDVTIDAPDCLPSAPHLDLSVP